MNSQITATIGFSGTIFIKLQNITLVLGNISANIFPKILPPSTTGAWQSPCNFLPVKNMKWKGQNVPSWILLKRVCIEAKFDRISDFPV